VITRSDDGWIDFLEPYFSVINEVEELPSHLVHEFTKRHNMSMIPGSFYMLGVSVKELEIVTGAVPRDTKRAASFLVLSRAREAANLLLNGSDPSFNVQDALLNIIHKRMNVAILAGLNSSKVLAAVLCSLSVDPFETDSGTDDWLWVADILAVCSLDEFALYRKMGLDRDGMLAIIKNDVDRHILGSL